MKQIERSVFKTLIIKWWNFNKSYINNDLIWFLKIKKKKNYDLICPIYLICVAFKFVSFFNYFLSYFGSTF